MFVLATMKSEHQSVDRLGFAFSLLNPYRTVEMKTFQEARPQAVQSSHF